MSSLSKAKKTFVKLGIINPLKNIYKLTNGKVKSVTEALKACPVIQSHCFNNIGAVVSGDADH